MQRSVVAVIQFSLLLSYSSSVYAICGDGVVESGEACDDGNTFNCDQCTNACTLGPQLDMVEVSGGEFTMGNNRSRAARNAHSVTVSDFVISRHEVTVAQYRACVNAGACTSPSTRRRGCQYSAAPGANDQKPVNCVSWAQTQDFTAWCMSGVPDAYPDMSLPTEAQWEYIAKANGSTYPTGNRPPARTQVHYNQSRQGPVDVCTVGINDVGGLMVETPYNLCDISGNVMEWIDDNYVAPYSRAHPADGTSMRVNGGRRSQYFIVRGGSYMTRRARELNASHRSGLRGSVVNARLGFRVACLLEGDISCFGGLCGNGAINGAEACDDGNTLTETCSYGEQECTVCAEDCTEQPGAVVGYCGDLAINGPETCDDGNAVTERCAYGEQACTVCAADCTEQAGVVVGYCGDGVKNGPEECDGGDDCQADCTNAPACVNPTPWGQISGQLLVEADLGYLPDVPQEPLEVVWGELIPLMDHEIYSETTLSDVELDPSQCEGPSRWPSDRVKVGPQVESIAAPNPAIHAGGDLYCRVQENDRTQLTVTSRWPMRNNTLMTGEPQWIQLRYPVPPGHQALSFTYNIESYSLNGSFPQLCHADDQDENGDCIFDRMLYRPEEWEDPVDPGIYVLWAAPGPCNEWTITGPHAPQGGIGFGAGTDFQVPVPEALRDERELVITLLNYRQIPGCTENQAVCRQRSKYYSIFTFNRARLRTQSSLDLIANAPSQDRPRLFGTNAEWLSRQSALNDLECTHARATNGGIPDIKHFWSLYTQGYSPCRNDPPLVSINDHPDVQHVYNGTLSGLNANNNTSLEVSLRILHLIRRQRACHQHTPQECQFTPQSVDQLAADFINIELQRFPQWVWWQWPDIRFDIRSANAFRYWSTFVDVLSQDLTQEQLGRIEAPLSDGITHYLRSYEERHWSIFNGNNWTTSLSASALYWAITYWYEDERAPHVAQVALHTLSLHKSLYLPDGTYKEGVSYGQYSFSDILILIQLAQHSLGFDADDFEGLLDWDAITQTGHWSLASLLSDGRTIDFSDSWALTGWNSFNPLLMMMVRELIGGEPVALDPCAVKQFFQGKYYQHPLQWVWTVPHQVARPWLDVIQACQAAEESDSITLWPNGGSALLRSPQPNATQTGQTPPPDGTVGRHLFADQTSLAVSGIPNNYPHTELDFGTLIWTAYGTRLLTDMGYGTIGGTWARYNTETAPDNNPLGHNTLIIEEATHPLFDVSNTSQINGESGTIEVKTVDGVSYLHLDGSNVYGALDPYFGGPPRPAVDDPNRQPTRFLQRFHRLVLPLKGGQYAVADVINARPERDPLSFQEMWHTRGAEDIDGDPGCAVAVERVSDQQVNLTPHCNPFLSDNPFIEGHGSITGFNVEGEGSFVVGESVQFTNRINQRDHFQRVRWVNDQLQTSDVRLFILASGVTRATVPQVSIRETDCAPHICLEAQVGQRVYTFEFSPDGSSWQLHALSGWGE